MSIQENQWSMVAQLLQRAGDEIRIGSAASDEATSADISSRQAQFIMFLENNEFGLAWDELASLADEAGAPPSFWQNLLVAAGLMSSAEQAHLASMRLCGVGPHASRAS